MNAVIGGYGVMTQSELDRRPPIWWASYPDEDEIDVCECADDCYCACCGDSGNVEVGCGCGDCYED